MTPKGPGGKHFLDFCGSPFNFRVWVMEKPGIDYVGTIQKRKLAKRGEGATSKINPKKKASNKLEFFLGC